ncbi:unnamed protein product [Orchesella dallaii]|uniref:Tetraspanin n=1 Tax=Orchesella dallaii TaxID=48710 RepID=A0ABP1RE22_9HEXA
MGKLLGPKCFLSSTFFLLSILSTYGIVGIVLNYLQLSRVHNFGNWPFNLRPAFVAFIIIQSLIPVAGLFALLAACRKQALFLYCSGFILLGVFTCCMVFGAVCLRASSQDILDDLYAAFKKTPNNPELIEWFENVQWQHKCCGIYGYEDWYQLRINSTNRGDAPVTCCRRRHEQCGEGALVPNEAPDPPFNPLDILYTNGCGPNISKIIREMSLWLGLEMWAVGGICFIVAIFLLCGVTKLFIATGNNLSFNGRGMMSSRRDRNDKNRHSTQPPSTLPDANNNITPVTTSKVSIGQRETRRVSEMRKKRLQAQGSNRRMNKHLFSLAPILSHSKLTRSNSSKQGCVIHANVSKSFILGEAHSNLMAPAGDGKNEINDTFLDMLWNQPVEKNVSTVSTTPNDTSSMTVGDSAAPQSRRPVGPVDFTNVMMNDSSMKTTVFTLVSERTFTPSLSQDCSIPFYNDIGKLPTMEGTALGQCSPHFSGSKQQRHVHNYPPTTSTEKEESDEESDIMQAPQTNTTNSPPQGVVSAVRGVEDNSENTEVVNSQGVGAPPPPLTTSKYLTSSVRSTTLATIHEESESVKGTPVNTKGSSPASGCMSPDVSPQPTKIFHKDGSEGSVAECPNESSNGNDNNNGSSKLTSDNSNSEENSVESQEYLMPLEEAKTMSVHSKGWNHTVNVQDEQVATSVLGNLAEPTMNIAANE